MRLLLCLQASSNSRCVELARAERATSESTGEQIDFHIQGGSHW